MKVFKQIFATIIVSFNFSALASENLVTPENYARAETDEAWRKIFEEVGSNTFRHDRGLVPIDKQPAVTMNRDTVYSLGIFHAPTGTTITLPNPTDGRYQSAMIMQNDDYTDQVFYAPGTFKIESETQFVLAIIRTQINPSNPSDAKNVKILQDKIRIDYPDGITPKKYKIVNWDQNSLEFFREKFQKEAAKLPNLNETSGARGVIKPDMLNLGASVALGLLPPQHAVYIYRDYGLKGDLCYVATYEQPPFKNGGFFSFTMYGSDKYLKDLNSNLNNRNIIFNDDGSFKIYYGPKEKCGNAANWLPTPGDNWYLGMRIYRPGSLVIKGKYNIPIPSIVP